MNRKSFIRNTLLGLCASLLPEVLRPMDVYDGKKYDRYLVDEFGQWGSLESHVIWEAGDFYYDVDRAVKYKPMPNGQWKVFLKPKTK